MAHAAGALLTALLTLALGSCGALRARKSTPLNLTDGAPKEFNLTRSKNTPVNLTEGPPNEFNLTRIPQLNLTMAGLDTAVAEGCPVCGRPEQVGTMPPGVLESSGITKSRRHAGVWYTINDSPEKPVVFAIKETGELVQTIQLAGVETDQQHGQTHLGDWEDVAVGPCMSGVSDSCIFVADIGHNCARTEDCHFSRRVQSIIRFPEPVGTEKLVAVRGERLWWRYPVTAGQFDAESLIVTQSGEMFIVTKENQDHSTVYHLADLRPGHTITAHPVLEVWTPDDGSTMFTGADVDEDDGRLVGVTLRTYTHVLHFPAREGEGVAQAMQRQPCVLPSPVMPQSEALGWDKPEGGFYLVTTEGASAPIMKVKCSAAPPATQANVTTWMNEVNNTARLGEVNGTGSAKDNSSRP